MLFNTWSFVVFFTLFAGGFYLLRNRQNARLIWLLAGSYFFYGFLDVRFLLPLLVTTAVDFFAGKGIAKGKHPKIFLALSIFVDLGILCTFKYLNFFTENLQTLIDAVGWDFELPQSELLLPIGISFYTFQSLSYTFGVYWKKCRPENNFLRYAAFTAMFPQILAGPIERAKNILPQLKHKPVIRSLDIQDGISLFIVGLFKKAVMADMVSVYVNTVYADVSEYSSLSVFLAAFFYSWQIYFDFSGYSDMARGVARMLGFRLMLNFDNPYTAVDVREFWRKWHISLSTWFKDHIYIPMGGGRCIKYRVWWNVMVTMVVSGFWHGAAWNFIIWGALNGLGSIISPRSDKSGWYGKVPRLIRQLLTFIFITVTWIFFRLGTVEESWAVLKKCVTFESGSTLIPVIPLLLTLVIWIWQLIYDSEKRKILENRAVRVITLSLMLILLLFLSGGGHEQFIYFQF